MKKGILCSIALMLSLQTFTFAQGEMMKEQEIIKAGSLGGFKGDCRNYGGREVTFSPGARTAWHTHPAGHTLIFTQGTIYTGTKGGITQIAKPGDVVLCPSDTEHWHGAGLTEKGVHIALTHDKDGKNVTWLELLSDEEYEGYIKEAEQKTKK